MIQVALATDEGYLPWCATLLQSCIEHNRADELKFHVLHEGGVPNEAQRQLARLVRGAGSDIEFHPATPSQLSQLPAAGGRVIWLRTLLPEVLPDVSRVLYLDGDTLVADSISSLWGTQLDAPIAAVANVVEPTLYAHVRRLGVEDPRAVFNSGVLLMDLDRMRRENSFDALAAFAREWPPDDLVWPDQDAYNAVFAGRWQSLHPRWNAQNSLWMWPAWAGAVFGEAVVQQARSAPAILHFEGPHLCKPWHYLSQHPWREEYLRTLARTPWADTGVQDRTAATRLIRRLPPSARLPTFVLVLRWRRRRDRRAARGPGRVRRVARRAFR
jgi:lipopolysaccharide biosynthesis glycosyltransferase